MDNHYIVKDSSQTSTARYAAPKAAATPAKKARGAYGPREGKTALNKIEGLFQKKSIRTVAEVANYLKIDAELVPRQIRRLGENRGYDVSIIKKNNRSYYQVR